MLANIIAFDDPVVSNRFLRHQAYLGVNLAKLFFTMST
ncbi:hypothetical protein JCM19236_6133 [Vibrio sp. JCM 19236]|nr:hypothetical protein JCM19236_6133 [Vibrio sp. JCM 19236]